VNPVRFESARSTWGLPHGRRVSGVVIADALHIVARSLSLPPEETSQSLGILAVNMNPLSRPTVNFSSNLPRPTSDVITCDTGSSPILDGSDLRPRRDIGLHLSSNLPGTFAHPLTGSVRVTQCVGRFPPTLLTGQCRVGQ